MADGTGTPGQPKRVCLSRSVLSKVALDQGFHPTTSLAAIQTLWDAGLRGSIHVIDVTRFVTDLEHHDTAFMRQLLGTLTRNGITHVEFDQ